MSMVQTVRLSASAARNKAAEVLSVLHGLYNHYRGAEISAASRRAVLDLYCRTNGRFTELIAPFLRMTRPARRPSAVDGLLGHFSVDDQSRIAGQIRRDGFFVFEGVLPSEVCDTIERFAKSTPAILEGHSRDVQARQIFDAGRPLAKKYYFAKEQIAANPGMEQLMGDPAFLAVAERYLDSLPMLSDVTLWWSAVHEGVKDYDAGQRYHFDFDTPPRWLMIFVYLTDVGPDNGPHMYIRGSHAAGLPAAGPLRARGYERIPDEEVLAAFGRDKVVELQGKRGTVLAVDTLGFHKGKPLQAGHRLMGQLIYSFAHFAGAHQSKVTLPSEVHPVLAQAIAANPRVYQKYL
jgi:hypothetical protein